MQENKYTLSDITRGMVVLENLERDFLWNNGVVTPIKSLKVSKERPVKKKEAIVELAECTS